MHMFANGLSKFKILIGACTTFHSYILQEALKQEVQIYMFTPPHRFMSNNGDSVISPPVTCVDTVTVHLHSQCSGACSDVQETAEAQS